MATPSAPTEEERNSDTGFYECNICFDQAKEAVVSLCGHLFCWPCIHKWMETRSSSATCPVCKSAIDKDRLIPLYGRGTAKQEDPRDNVPPRPPGQREEPVAQPAGGDGYGMNGIHVSFGIGAFPFTMLGMPLLQAFGPQVQQQPQGAMDDPRQREQQQMVTKFLIAIAVLVFLSIFLS
eukprot:Em0015g1260a